jgi:lysophospholipase L1-like esterase
MHRNHGFRLLVLIAASLALLESAIRTPKIPKRTNSAVFPISRNNSFWMDRHNRSLVLSRQGKIDLLFLGDSLTQGWEEAGKQVWNEYYSQWNAANFGIAGDQTGHILWRITIGKELEAIFPKVIVLLIGTNNIRIGNTPAETAIGVRAILAELRKQKPNTKILLLGVFPRANPGISKEFQTISSQKLNRQIPLVNNYLRKFSDGQNVFYLDIGKVFLEKDGGISREIMPDFIHLSERGYRIWASSIQDTLDRLMQ